MRFEILPSLNHPLLGIDVCQHKNIDVTVNLIIKAEVKVRGVPDYGLDTKMKLKMQTHDMTGPSSDRQGLWDLFYFK